MKKINAQIVADSLSPQGNRITSFILTYPRFIHSELMTHRMFSRNSASSRAIPFEKMLKMVEEDPFYPIAWQEEHKGMQGNRYLTDLGGYLKGAWLLSKDSAINQAKLLSSMNLTKQLCNRILEPFMWHTVLVTATEYENFFDLRCPKYHTPVSGEGFTFRSKKDCIANHSNPDNVEKLENYSLIDWLKINQSQAEIHMQALAECMWDAYNESKPKQLKEGEWHIPFGDQMDSQMLYFYSNDGDHQTDEELKKEFLFNKLKVAIARCARLSYMTFEGEIDYEKDIKLHDTLLKSGHMSPFEHVTRAMTNNEYYEFFKGEVKDPKYYNGNGWCNNFKGFIPYRYLIENNKNL